MQYLAASVAPGMYFQNNLRMKKTEEYTSNSVAIKSEGQVTRFCMNFW